MELVYVIKMATKWKSQGPRGKKKTIWTKMANLDKTQGLKWQFTQNQTMTHVTRLYKWGDELGSWKYVLAMTLKTMAQNMFVAGSDTSFVTIEWAMSELMKNPRVMKKVQDELRHVLKGKTKIHESDIEELDYLKLVIKETLRLHPPLPFLIPRECRESCEIGGFSIPIKTKVLINTWMIGRDPDYWIEPQSFIPERFSESAANINLMGTNFEYLPFGAGRRMCPAMLLGLANVELPLAMLLYHFDWELPNRQTYEKLDMSESSGATLKRKNNLLLVSHPYNTKY
ncbi:putative oxidoreductase [Helianthus annuus]|nr:putative oxidoreductase [Helianthus annuus]